MAELPAPTTRSPGKLRLLYMAGILPHEVSTNFNDTVDVTDTTTIRTEAHSLAVLVQACMPNTCVIEAWRIVNPDGVTLYEEAFSPALVGTRALPTDGLQSESATQGVTGKGAPAVGFKQGQMKFDLFCNYYSPAAWSVAKQPITFTGTLAAVRDFLNASTVTGCDFYGSPGVWRNYLVYQINAHYQKKYGI